MMVESLSQSLSKRNISVVTMEKTTTRPNEIRKTVYSKMMKIHRTASKPQYPRQSMQHSVHVRFFAVGSSSMSSSEDSDSVWPSFVNEIFTFAVTS